MGFEVFEGDFTIRKQDRSKSDAEWTPKVNMSGLGPCCKELINAKARRYDEKDGRTLLCPRCTAVVEYHHGQWQLKYFYKEEAEDKNQQHFEGVEWQKYLNGKG